MRERQSAGILSMSVTQADKTWGISIASKSTTVNQKQRFLGGVDMTGKSPQNDNSQIRVNSQPAGQLIGDNLSNSGVEIESGICFLPFL